MQLFQQNGQHTRININHSYALSGYHLRRSKNICLHGQSKLNPSPSAYWNTAQEINHQKQTRKGTKDPPCLTRWHYLSINKYTNMDIQLCTYRNYKNLIQLRLDVIGNIIMEEIAMGYSCYLISIKQLDSDYNNRAGSHLLSSPVNFPRKILTGCLYIEWVIPNYTFFLQFN